MNYTALTPEFAAAPQIVVDDLAEIAALGYRSVMCNRPDGEDPGQTDFATIASAGRAHGLVAAHVPVVSGQIAPENLEDFRAAIAALPQPVFAYCRSGTRCRMLWQMTR
jgi:uncharacterized protein (TIGR01244 family)